MLFGADYGEEIRKGFRGLMGAMTRCLDDPWFSIQLREGRIRFICFGNPDPEIARGPVPIHALGYLKDDADLAAAYGAADFFVLPSLEDNLPNTVLESMSCGTPVLALDVGGVRDMVIEERTGWLTPPGDEVSFAALLLKILREPAVASAMAAACREHVVAGFSQTLQAQRFAELYQDLLRHQPLAELPRITAYPCAQTRLDCGPRMRSVLPEVLKSAIIDMEAGSEQSVLKQSTRLRRSLERELQTHQSYEDFLKGLEKAWFESTRTLSRRERLMERLRRCFKQD